MKRAFREAYERELALLKEKAAEFAQDYPGLADRLGGLLEENLDPTAKGLLEGTAYLAARVQLRLDEERRSFSRELLDQLFPDALTPTPAVMLLAARPPCEQAEITRGLPLARGATADARFLDADRRVACRFALAGPLVLWPLAVTGAAYHGAPGPIGALGQEIAPGCRAGLVFDLARLGVSGRPDPASPLAELATDSLTLHLTGPMAEATALYEQIHCDRLRVSLRWLDGQGDPVFARLPRDCLETIGFGEDELLFGDRPGPFQGFARLREYFVFPRKFLGFRLTGLAAHLPRIRAGLMQVVVEFGSARPRLSGQVDPDHLVLNAAPAVNLFEEISAPVRLDQKRHEFLVQPNSSPASHYELHGLREVWAFYAEHSQRVPVLPLYALPRDGEDPRQALYYTIERKPRRLTPQERQFGASRYRYRGTETFLTLYEPPQGPRAQRLQLRALASNRHLAEVLPIAHRQDDFALNDDRAITFSCLAGPTAPRDSLVELDSNAPHRHAAGDVYWRLISYLMLHSFGIDGQPGRAQGADSASALRELLSLFGDLGDAGLEAQIQALRGLETRPVTRTIALADGYHSARGLQVTLTFDETGFEGASMVVLGAVLDRFLAEHSAVNSFTQTVLVSLQRGPIITWPPRAGQGPLL